jgi:predicted dithiol-disulfide oxidoreductase (DUF899 family)
MSTDVMAGAELLEAERQLMTLREHVAALRRALPRHTVEDYELLSCDGPIRLSDLFAGRQDLILVFNMGMACASCTMWADGLQGLLGHLEDRAAFAVVSGDDASAQRAFGGRRGWTFSMASHAGTTLAADLGFTEEDGSPLPGVATFRRVDGGRIERVLTAEFGPGDAFCAVPNLFDLLADGPNGWRPQIEYAKRSTSDLDAHR